ncbi:MAG TPA: nicotinate phosphoribosyltransferase [Polyangiaceae bacterium]|jgi:nicotinate phosphoribosyltransferase|nr:MAG: Nicotinate phosphoribosyltransferase pncB2 [Deltaproteobacteria bacterium ADurb.Bin207]HNS96861.1 nicotinate phosphoribosyltransferase [Polyangiaceae bacterium]HNZ20986.1 nicotinate phosphoribosyltransferase [Polyangiaceae bacterium]HOD23865.1 nicotinate phosphoribosyltransferase [Polyangiaceae bacterium]HOE48852.1 nicotinate phosphoribosyltransferase [Polyangiaceae bacterium]
MLHYPFGESYADEPVNQEIALHTLSARYRHSLTLLTDLYQLTMAYGYWKNGLADRQAVFHLAFRKCPFGGGYAIAAGLHDVVGFLESMRFDESDISFLHTLHGHDGKPLFEPEFLRFLGELTLECDLDAIPEGTAVFAHEPLIRVRGPLVQAQIIETALLNIINFQTLIATKAARVCFAAKGKPVLEFGLRRAQGIDGALSASRAAYIGGCEATSNVLAGKLFGIPVRGTHAHSWVMVFDDELEAFAAYARAMPNNCVFLVDTYDTLEGVRNAVQIGHRLREQGHELSGVRLDSGDLAFLSIEARKILDEAGFPNAAIVASNDLDEQLIDSLQNQGAAIGVWGVGTKLVTAFDQAALGGVYKLSAIQDACGQYQPKIKLSEQAVKISTPGILNVRRFRLEGQAIGDMVFDELDAIPDSPTIVDPADATRRKVFSPDMTREDLLEPVFRKGRLVRESPPIDAIRMRVKSQLEALHAGVKRFLNPHSYPVGLEEKLFNRRRELVFEARGHHIREVK